MKESVIAIKFQDAVYQQVNSSSWLRRWLFYKAFDAKSKAIDAGKTPSPFWDRLVFSKIRQAFGGRIRVATSGSAPLSVGTAKFLRIVFADEVVEGYGLTETNAVGTTSSPYDKNTYGHVGALGSIVEMKIVDVPEMQYLFCKKKTKICDYNPEATKEVLREDGWFATGDIGKWRLDGKLQLIDRKKTCSRLLFFNANILASVLAQGEYIRPEYIEGIYKRSLYVGNIFVHGNSDETYLVAVVYPDPEVFAKWATQNGLGSIANNLEALIKEPGVKSVIEKDMERVALEESLQGYERVKKFILVKDDFTVENGLLTSSMKLKRHVAKKKFAEEIKKMYSEPILIKAKL
ncbi:hypothetical protein RFI_14656 [Reticulomyxa filosa]|uniref:AMP-dependent synthetase/ligase domain-containing protein n=1 Tax=Reticulomyxa filosa TaxID=46433 RepID=X6N916_RETFI|nr:hypothetical protein RFI_14656 [Reticulomyxa filosa]|eukprot:ETO22541.1 hypothetical protein RFI_14656 [Reticulomyxa filosa]